MTTKEKYLNPLTDFGFKKLFGPASNKVLLIDFLNEILPTQHRITDLRYAPTEQLGPRSVDRRAFFDLYCIGENGSRFIVEMQKVRQNYFKDRSVYYASFPIQEQATQGPWNFKLDAVYMVGVLDFIFDDHKEEEELLHIVELKDQRCEVFFDKLKFIYIELPKFKKTIDELETHFDKWLYLLQRLWEFKERPAAFQEKVFQQLFRAAEIAQFDNTERLSYRESLKHYWDLNNVLEASMEEGWEKGWENGKDAGRKEGIREGIEEGKKVGIEEGKKEGIKEGLKKGWEEGISEGVKQIAQKMKAAQVPISQIAELSGLSLAQIKAL